MAIGAAAKPWKSGPFLRDLRQHESVPFIDPVEMGVLVDGGEDFDTWLEEHYWPVRAPKDKYGRQVPSVTKDGKKYGNRTRHFGAKRPVQLDPGAKLRWHCGVDLGGGHLDVVVACAPGVVVSIHTYHLGTWGMLVETPKHGAVIHYGEIEKDSWKEFGISETKKVEGGQPIARIGKMNQSSMLHFEMYRSTTTRPVIGGWDREKPAPEKLRDPTKYLLFLARYGL